MPPRVLGEFTIPRREYPPANSGEKERPLESTARRSSENAVSLNVNTPPANSGEKERPLESTARRSSENAVSLNVNTPPANSGEKDRRGYSDQTTPDKGD